MTLKHQPWNNSERLEVLKIAHRHLLFTRRCYLWAKEQVNNPMSSLPNNGMALNICGRYKELCRRAADRVKVLLYDVQDKRPGQ